MHSIKVEKIVNELTREIVDYNFPTFGDLYSTQLEFWAAIKKFHRDILDYARTIIDKEATDKEDEVLNGDPESHYTRLAEKARLSNRQVKKYIDACVENSEALFLDHPLPFVLDQKIASGRVEFKYRGRGFFANYDVQGFLDGHKPVENPAIYSFDATYHEYRDHGKIHRDHAPAVRIDYPATLT